MSGPCDDRCRHRRRQIAQEPKHLCCCSCVRPAPSLSANTAAVRIHTCPLVLCLEMKHNVNGTGPFLWQRGQCGQINDPDPPHGAARATARAWGTGVVWQVLTCWSGTVDILARVCRQNGVGGMYQGMRAKLLHTVLTSALLFLGYERLLQVKSFFVVSTRVRALVDSRCLCYA